VLLTHRGYDRLAVGWHSPARSGSRCPSRQDTGLHDVEPVWRTKRRTEKPRLGRQPLRRGSFLGGRVTEDVLSGCTEVHYIYSLDGYDRAIRVVLRTDYDSAVKTAGRVALISGGGSGPPASELANRVYVRTRRSSFVDAQGTSRRMPALSARGCLLLQCAGTSSPRHQSVLRACRSTSAHRICALAWP
jgi:hypothetical protein